MSSCPIVSKIGEVILERATQGTSSDIDVSTIDLEVGDLLYLSVNKDDEDAGYVAAVIDGGDPDWVVLAGGQTDHFWKRVDADDIGATFHVAYGPGDRYCVITIAAFRCTNTVDPVVAYDTDTTGLTEVTTHPVPGLVAPAGDYLDIAGIELGKDNPGAITFPDGWTVFGGGESPGGLGTVPTTSSAIAFRRFSGSNPPSFDITSANAKHSGTWRVLLQAELDPVGWDVYAAADPNGERVVHLTHAYDRQFRDERDGPGKGAFKINRHAEEVPFLTEGSIVRVRIPELGDDYVFAFELRDVSSTLASAQERGDEELQFSGPGVLALLDRAIMLDRSFTSGLDINDTWTKIWQTGAIPNPVGACLLDGDPDYLYVISGSTRKIYKLRQSDRVVVATTPALWSGSSNWAGGLCADPTDNTIMWALETPWFTGSANNTKIRKVNVVGALSAWSVAATFDLGSAIQLTDIEADATDLYTTRYNNAVSLQQRSKTTGAVTDSFTIVYGGVTQTDATGSSINGTEIALWYAGKKRALIADLSDPETIIRKINTTGLSAFGGAWTTEGGEDYFYPVSYTADQTWKYQVTVATPRDPVDGIWRLDDGTAIAIAYRLIAEWQHVDRPQQPIPFVAIDFTATTDSDGNAAEAIDGVLEYTAKIGDKGMGAMLRLAAYGPVFRMSPLLVFSAYNTFGTDRSSATFAAGKVRLEKGISIASDIQRRVWTRRLDTYMLAEGDGKIYAEAELEDLGYAREGFVATQLSDATALAGTAEAELEQERTKQDAVALGVRWGDDELNGKYLPYVHYGPGDVVRIHTGTAADDFNEDDLTLYAIQLNETEANEDDIGGWRSTVELRTGYLQPGGGGTTSGGSAGGTGQASSPATGSLLLTARDAINGDTAKGSTVQSPDLGVTQDGVGVIGVTVRRWNLDEGRNVDTGGKEDGDLLTWDETLEAWIAAPPASALIATDGVVTVNPVQTLATALGGVEDAGGDIALLRVLTDRYGGQATYVDLGDVGAAAELDCSVATVFDVTLSEACTVTIVSPGPSGVESAIRVILRGNDAVTWPAAVTFFDDATGLATADPDLTLLDADAQTVVELATVDGGTTWGASLPHAPHSHTVESLETAETDTGLVLAPDGAGGVEFVSPGAASLDLSGLTAETSIQGLVDVVAGYDASAADERGFPVGFLPRSRQHTVIGADMNFPSGSTITADGTMIDSPFVFASGGTATVPSATSVVSDSSHPGIVQIETGTVATNRAGLTTPNNYLGRRCRWISVLKIPTLSTSTQRFSLYTGLGNAIGSTTMADGIGFRYSDNVNGGKWQAILANGGETTADTGITADTGWHTFEAEANAANTEAKFYIDGTLVATITSTISASGLQRLIAANIVKSVGTTSRSVQIDMASVIFEMGAAR